MKLCQPAESQTSNDLRTLLDNEISNPFGPTTLFLPLHMPIPLARPGATHRFVSQDEKFSFTTTLRVETRLFAEKKNETLPVPSCIRVTTMEYAILDIIGQIEIDETILDWIDGTLKLVSRS